MARISVSLEVHMDRAMEALEAAAEQWPEKKREAFAAEWSELELAGAQIADMQVIGGRFVAYPSEDFMRHLEAYGVHLW